MYVSVSLGIKLSIKHVIKTITKNINYCRQLSLIFLSYKKNDHRDSYLNPLLRQIRITSAKLSKVLFKYLSTLLKLTESFS